MSRGHALWHALLPQAQCQATSAPNMQLSATFSIQIWRLAAQVKNKLQQQARTLLSSAALRYLSRMSLAGVPDTSAPCQ